MSQISCLKRITIKDQQSCEKFNQIVLKKDSNQIFIGRDIDCNYRISSIEISRKHALLEYSPTDNYWTVSDLNSTNGLFINSIQLQSNSPYRLVDGDRVSFGPPNQSQFCYQFVDNYSQNQNTNCVSYELSAINLTTIPVIPIVTRIQTTSTNSSLLSSSLHFDIEPNQSRTISLTTTMPTRSGLTYSSSSSGSRRASCSIRKTSVDNRDTQSLNEFVEHDYSRNSSSNRSSDKNNKNKRMSLKLKTDNEVSSPKSKSSKSSELERKLIAKEKEKLEKSKKSLEQQKTMDRLKIKRKEEELKKKQKELERKEMDAKKREDEIEKIRKDLLKEKKRLTEKRQELTKESEQNCRQSAKRKLRSSSARESTDAKRQCTEDIKQKAIEDILESELTCSVCSEYFIQAVNLNCSHTFCLGCIEEWKKSKTGTHVCPICREKIENQNRELILDNLIDQFVGQMKPHLKEHRLKLTEERKKRMEKKANQSQNNGSTSSRGHGLSRLIPSLHFFLRSSPMDSDSDTDDVDVIGLNFGNSFLNSSSSSDSSDTSSESEDESESSDSSVESNSSDELTLSDGDQSAVASIASPHLSYNSDSDSDESIVSIHSNDSEIRINLFDSFGEQDLDTSSDDSDFSTD